MISVDIDDKKADETWLGYTLEDFWNLVKAVRVKSGPRERKQVLWFEGTEVEVTVRRIKP